MASFAQYQQPIGSNAHEFNYPAFTWESDPSYLQTTDESSFTMGYPQQAYNQDLNEPYPFNPEQLAELAKYDTSQQHSQFQPEYTYDQQPPVLSSTSDSGASVQSAMSSNMGSPNTQPQQANEWQQQFNMFPSIYQQDGGIPTSIFETGTIPGESKIGCVDPSLIQPFSPMQSTGAQYPDVPAIHSPHMVAYPMVPSPAPSALSARSPRSSIGKAHPSPHLHAHSYQPYPTSRRPSVSSIQSRHSQGSSSDESNKGLCPYPTCGRHFKDLKAHILTHQNERPEKCPIPTCEYHTKGFARKYDKNRHTLTHYKGTMVCGFCPGSGSSAEKSFNRADVFKRHLTSVHGVEQTPPNARRKSPAGGKRSSYSNVRDVAGMCSTCGVMFANAQEFYEHLDDCVLRVVQQAEPSEAINEKLLMSVADDPAVHASMKKHNLPTTVDYGVPASFEEEDDEEDAPAEDDDEDDDAKDGTYGASSGRSGKNATRTRRSTNGNSR